MAAQSLGLAVSGDLRPVATVTVPATVDQVSLKAPVKQLRVRNTHATQTLTLNCYGGDTEALAVAAAATANTANALVALTNGIVVMPGETVTVWKSKRSQYVCANMIGSAAGTTANLIGTLFTEGT